MGFDWTENIGVGASVDPADLIEVRTNVDTVDDEKCAADNPGYYSDQHGTYENGHLAGYDSTYKPGYYNDQHGAYESGDEVGVLLANNPGYQLDYHSDYFSNYNPYIFMYD